ncbi:MAG: hypothetical protein FJY81_01770 [Candidatus Aminicenantes bacterium]|nr:hypothetical protein [Candidatus Aminicenantes bacterium]
MHESTRMGGEKSKCEKSREDIPAMKLISRTLKIELPAKQSAFLWGLRKTGKSTFLKNACPDSIFIDLLDTDQQFEFMKRPALLRERLLAAPLEARRLPVIVDEVQKVPALLDEIHRLIENQGWRFILCGSSARKVKRSRGADAPPPGASERRGLRPGAGTLRFHGASRPCFLPGIELPDPLLAHQVGARGRFHSGRRRGGRRGQGLRPRGSSRVARPECL